MKKSLALYWLKRDFRLLDNPALTAALAGSDQVVPLFILEPSFIEAPETSAFHVHAITNALKDLRKKLQLYGSDVSVVIGEVVPILDELFSKKQFDKIYAHEEIGINRTYQRDLAVIAWCKQNEVIFEEHRQTAVFRGSVDRNKRHRDWKKFMETPVIPPPADFSKCMVPKEWKGLFFTKRKNLTNKNLGFELTSDQRKHIQAVSETDAEKTLKSFHYERGVAYRGGISSPLTAFTAGSRMSVHFAWGTMTARTVYQRTRERMEALQILKEEGDPLAGKWKMSLRNFLSRIHWRDHFIQRLETEPDMEFHALNPAYDALEYDNNPDFLEAWKIGTTGYPMVDACIRCLHTTGFLNFRMRAMITSFACHTLHLDWKLIDHPMARLYTDYEPGIHLSQLQMQASVVGINTVRVYSPTKQIVDQDPDAVFIKKFVPELRDYSPADIIGHREAPLGDYPGQLVEWKEASSEMKSRIYAVRRTENYRAIAEKVYQKHGSRKSNGKKKTPAKRISTKKKTA